MSHQSQRETLWQELLLQVRTEYRQLNDQERAWISTTCNQISLLQSELDQLFRQADGVTVCGDCQGDCCALGHNHLTLANLLLFFVQAVEIPELDYSATCPLLGVRGCLLPAGQRPYNCISFLCDRIEDKLQQQEVERFYLIESELRKLYGLFAARYTGGSMSGLLLAARRLQGRPFLQRII